MRLTALEIQTAQKLMQDLIDSVNSESLCSDLRIAVVAYRDHKLEVSKYKHNENNYDVKVICVIVFL